MKLLPTDYPGIIADYRDNLVPMAELARSRGVTRMAIWKILHRAGIDTTKAAAHIQTTCDNCGAPVTKLRCQVRKTKHSFCNNSCASRWLNRKDPDNPLINRRHGLRLARKMVSEYFLLPPGAIVHHEDRNQNNNQLFNLRAFASQSDHIKYHRGQNITPIWDGSKLPA